MAKSRKAHRAEMARLNSELQKAVDEDVFMKEWLSEVEQYKPIFERDNQGLSEVQRERVAKEQGYRTWRQYMTAVDAINELHRLFVHHDAFQRLWAALKESDCALGWCHLYGPHNGGVPLSLARAIVQWHQMPKFTKAERKRHCEKIVRLCTDLQVLVEQITPGVAFDDPFRYPRISEEQATRLLKAFQSPNSWLRDRKNLPPWHRQRTVQRALEMGGIDAIWCIQNIANNALNEPSFSNGPTKIKAKSAYKTYLILSLSKIILKLQPIKGLNLLIADVVAAITGNDCSDEDVRKALASREVEDFESRE